MNTHLQELGVLEKFKAFLTSFFRRSPKKLSDPTAEGLQKAFDGNQAAVDAMRLLQRSDPETLKNQNWQVRRPHKR